MSDLRRITTEEARRAYRILSNAGFPDPARWRTALADRYSTVELVALLAMRHSSPEKIRSACA